MPHKLPKRSGSGSRDTPAKDDPSLFEDHPAGKVRFLRPTGDTAVPIGKWLIRVSQPYYKALKLDAMDEYILNEYLASADSVTGGRCFHYHPETLRILKCQTWDAYMDEAEGVLSF